VTDLVPTPKHPHPLPEPGRTSVAPKADPRPIRVALAGNPNSGKTTIFNRLTGARQHVGNYPGVTVERKEGACRHAGRDLRILDLPGTYSLTAYSAEELIARNVLIHETPDVVIDIIDASNLERNLYLALQLIELGVPLVLAFNMSDVAAARGIELDLARLSGLLGVPIVSTVGHRGKGIPELLDCVLSVAGRENGCRRVDVAYGPTVEREIDRLARVLQRDRPSDAAPPTRWLAVKLLEKDDQVRRVVASPEALSAADESAGRIERHLPDPAEVAIAERRYAFISDLCAEAVRRSRAPGRTLSDRIDAVVTSRALGIPVFLLFMFLTFQFTFSLGDPVMGWIETLFARLAATVDTLWPPGSESPLKSLIVDGVIGGVGGVIVFLPNIVLLFLAIAVLEDTGYMARAAFVMDRLMHKIGLHGKSFVPMVIGFGCSVPAIMATRTLENRRDRLTTMLVIPLMSCGARLPIYALLIPAFFPPAWYAPMLMLIYLIGIALAVVSAKLLRSTILRGPSSPFVMELPPYRLPTVGAAFIHTWDRAWMYLRKAGTIILGISILLWAMTAYPKKADPVATAPAALQAEQLAFSVSGRIGHALEPVLRPLGFDWKIGTALIGALAAKEVFVAQMGIVYSIGDADEDSEALREELRRTYSPLVAFCIMLFCLISAPCMATLAVIRRESGSWRWALFQTAGLTVIAYILTFAVFQLGSLLGLGTA